jgi:uncharacterized protein (DUF1778 family)
MKPRAPTFPSVSLAEVEQSLRKTETINLRVSAVDKAAIRAAAKALGGLTVSEYLIKAHQAVARHL